MTMSNLQKADPQILAQFLDVEDSPRRIWPAEELDAILRHQLATPVQLDLESAGSAFKAKLYTLPTKQQPGKLTYAELFHHPSPPPDLLRLVKQFAKASRVRGESVLPPEIATVLYLASIVVARLRCGLRISEQSDESLLYGIQWVLDQRWVDGETHKLFQQALEHHKSGR
jgi:hypothetical protein